uniref:EF-hand domain-containing protein n=1 Tax=Glossina palpalis gambiensis TaxID=67801 RepID=A0A1B0BQB6_9MUSC
SRKVFLPQSGSFPFEFIALEVKLSSFLILVEIYEISLRNVFKNGMDSLIPSIVIDHPNGSAMDACFTAFDKDGDGRLDLAEFTLICRALFRNDRGHIYDVPAERLEQIFSVFDTNGDGYIDRDEFKFCWNQWIKTVRV